MFILSALMGIILPISMNLFKLNNTFQSYSTIITHFAPWHTIVIILNRYLLTTYITFVNYA